MSRAGVAGAYQADARRAWLLLLAKTCEVCRTLDQAGRAPEIELRALVALHGQTKAPFPVAWPSARPAAEAFRGLLAGLIATSWSPWLVKFVLAGAEALEAMLIADGQAHAAADRRRLGEVDE